MSADAKIIKPTALCADQLPRAHSSFLFTSRYEEKFQEKRLKIPFISMYFFQNGAKLWWSPKDWVFFM